MRSIGWFVAAALLVQWPGTVEGWGRKGHEMTARVAARALPEDMPAFFRNAELELGYLCPEPDRWRRREREPALWGLADRDHIVKLELVTGPLPPNRYDFLLGFTGKPAPWGGAYRWSDVGFAPYAIAEHVEMLTVSFMLWRKAPDATEAERRVKRQIEQNIIHIAGLLSHFITDTAQPLHTTVHVGGWAGHVPNPKGYTPEGQEIHGRYETTYIDRAIEERDFEPLVGRPKEVGPWLEAALAHITAAHQHVEKVFELDKAGRFGDGKESPEAKRFTCERLAHAAASLRDFWYAAWVKSATLPVR